MQYATVQAFRAQRSIFFYFLLPFQGIIPKEMFPDFTLLCLSNSFV